MVMAMSMTMRWIRIRWIGWKRVIVGFVIADEVEVTAGAKVFNRYLAPSANQQIISTQDRSPIQSQTSRSHMDNQWSMPVFWNGIFSEIRICLSCDLPEHNERIMVTPTVDRYHAEMVHSFKGGHSQTLATLLTVQWALRTCESPPCLPQPELRWFQRLLLF